MKALARAFTGGPLASVRARAGAALVGFFIFAALLSIVWTPHDPTGLDMAARLAPPSWSHPLGANALGRDVLSSLMAGARATLFVALIAVGIGAGLGAALGLTAAIAGGFVDDVIARTSDFAFAFPAVIVALLIAAIIGPGAGVVVTAVAFFNIPVFARLSRALAGPLWRRDFVAAARIAGKSPTRIALEHLLPNMAGVLATQATIQISFAALAEAGLSYIGLGVQPPFPSWGRMLAEGQTMLSVAPWLALAPGAAIFLLVLGFNLLGAGFADSRDVRDAA